MIASRIELKVAVRNLRTMEQSLGALKAQLETSNLDLLAMTSPAYARRIEGLQTEITRYLYGHPSDLSVILPPAEAPENEAIAA